MLEVVANSKFANLTSKSSQEVNFGNGSKRVAAPVTPATASVDLNVKIPSKHVSARTTNVNLVPAASNIHNVDNRKEMGEGSNDHIDSLSMMHDCSDPFQPTAVPFSGMPMTDDSVIDPVTYTRIHPFKRFQKFREGMGIYHRGVQCNGCGVHPIIGPRFKSNVK